MVLGKWLAEPPEKGSKIMKWLKVGQRALRTRQDKRGKNSGHLELYPKRHADAMRCDAMREKKKKKKS